MRFLGVFAAAGLVACAGGGSPLDDGTSTVTSRDARGVPRMLVANGQFADTPRAHVERLAARFGVLPTALPELAELGDIRLAHARVTRIAQSIDGLPIWGGELRVLERDSGELKALAGTLVGTTAARTPKRFIDDEAGAIAKAMRRAGNTVVERSLARQVWYRSGNALVAAWVVDAYTSKPGGTSDANRTIIAGDDGRILEHYSLTADVAFDYRVFAETTGEKHPLDGPTADFSPHPTGMPGVPFPPYVPPSLVRVDSLNSLGDPWLDADATTTSGNNVDAYADPNGDNGPTGAGFRATTTSALAFDRVYDTSAEPLVSQTQQMASITSLFYVINWLHDFWYDNGFTEVAGNAQRRNYERGGVEGDPILAEAQDDVYGGSRNNANMATPDDGLSPRMQVYLWRGKQTRTLTLSPSGRTPIAGGAAFGVGRYTVTAPVVLGVDGAGANPNDGCEPFTGDLTGKIVLVDRGNCTYKRKVLDAQNANAMGVLIADNMASSTPPSLGDDAAITETITIAAMSITQAEGVAVKADLAAGPVTATMHREVSQELDGALDSTLIAHEYGHYLHHRLSLCGNAMCRAMSEGWGDFTALMLLARPNDNLDGAFPISVYSTQSYVTDPGYYGIRRAPYSVNPDINGLSYRHMANGEPLPTGNFLASNQNSEVHNAGEVWAEALWEVYVALQKAGTDFLAARAKMARYVVAGLAMTPTEASPMEVRDALLAVAAAESQADHDVMLAAFARRGFGSCAEPPPSASASFVGLVESTIIAGKPELEVLGIDDGCDQDGVLDRGELGVAHIKVTNKGHAPLGNVAVTASATTPDIVFYDNANLEGPAAAKPIGVGDLAPGEVKELYVWVGFTRYEPGVSDPVAGDLQLAVSADNACEQSVSFPLASRLNVDDVAEASTTDTFDATDSTWIASSPIWQHVRPTPLDGEWHGDDAAQIDFAVLQTPRLKASASEPVRVSFEHRYSFEYSDGTAYDGAVIELVTVDGDSELLRDISEFASPSYTGVIAGTDNPLMGREGYVGKNPGYPATETVTLDLGDELAGQEFYLRFIIGTDPGTSDQGWTIDNVAFTGIVGKPFPSQVGDDGDCSGEGPDMEIHSGGGGCCDAGSAGGSGALSLVALALVLRRRRR
ncbi:MAG: hypothetical protein HOV81_14305 [Kofleriaceae bacterium]|nr:hypothetical protein [Kofleriaceae bacterium]